MDKLINKYRPANYEDCFHQTLIGKERMGPRDLFNLIFVQYPKPAQYLLKFRNMLVKPSGLKTGGGFADMIIEENETELVLGKQDKHLDFYIILECEPPCRQQQNISLTTLIEYNNLLGKIYFFIIRIFHTIIIKSLMGRAVKIWSKKVTFKH